MSKSLERTPGPWQPFWAAVRQAAAELRRTRAEIEARQQEAQPSGKPAEE